MEINVAKLDEAVEYIALARASGGKAMSHCWYGRNRSVTLLVAYLMKYEKLSSEEALLVVQKTRSTAAPYQNVLDAYRERYLNG
jgi:protein-tyrosine phosphatase